MLIFKYVPKGLSHSCFFVSASHLSSILPEMRHGKERMHDEPMVTMRRAPETGRRGGDEIQMYLHMP